MHGLTFAEAIGSRSRKWKHVRQLELIALKNCHHIFVVSSRMQSYLTKQWGISTEKMTIIPNGGSPQKTHATYRRPLRVIYAGGFSYWEKVEDFIKIAKYADKKRYKFFLAGDGPLRSQLIEQIKQEHIPISYLGSIPRQKIFHVLSKMNVGIAPSTNDLTYASCVSN